MNFNAYLELRGIGKFFPDTRYYFTVGVDYDFIACADNTNIINYDVSESRF